jgi:hypothetical protein
LKLLSDIYLLSEFRSRYIRENLQANDLNEDYWDNTLNLEGISVHKEYHLRYAITNINIIKSGSALLIIIFPLIMLYNWRFHTLMSGYMSRFFYVMKELIILLAYFALIAFSLLFAFDVITNANYDMPAGSWLSEIRNER